MDTDIIIPVWNELAATKRCLDSIMAKTACPYRLIIIDNASARETAEYLASLVKSQGHPVQLVRNNSNFGFARAVNQGLRISTEPYICVLNNDTEVTAGWLKETIKVMDSDPSIGIVNPSSNTSGQFPDKGESRDAYALRLKDLSGNIQELYNARGFCMLAKRQLIDKIGLLDETYGIGYFEETDYSVRAHKAGFRIVRAKAAYVYHEEGASFKHVKGKEDLFRRNESSFIKKWGRPVRLGYLVNKIKPGSDMSGIVETAVRNGHRVVIFLAKNLEIPGLPDHFNIRVVRVNRKLFGLSAFLRILKRRSRKGLDLILTDDALLGGFLGLARALHGAEVMVRPDRARVRKLLEKLTSEPGSTNRLLGAEPGSGAELLR